LLHLSASSINRDINMSGSIVFVAANIRAAANCADAKLERETGSEEMMVER